MTAFARKDTQNQFVGVVPGDQIARCCQRSIFASESQPEGSECWLSVRLAVGMENIQNWNNQARARFRQLCH